MKKAKIAAIILTYNEAQHIERCIASIKEVCAEIFVIDCMSTDDTSNLAIKAGATAVLTHPWKNHATQFNWGLENAPLTAEWVWRIDADEYITPALATEMRNTIDRIHDNDQITGVFVRKRIDFIGRPLLHGGWYPRYVLKVFRRGHGECENRWMDEHIRLKDGDTVTINKRNADQVDANLNDLTWWTQKHNKYATLEMLETLALEYGLDEQGEQIAPKLYGTNAERKRWLKMRYVKFPLFVRPAINFFYRYIILGGFLDGKEGLMWHVLQGFWYRFLVDAKIYEVRKRLHHRREDIEAWIKKEYL